jgi:hypothetical protein
MCNLPVETSLLASLVNVLLDDIARRFVDSTRIEPKWLPGVEYSAMSGNICGELQGTMPGLSKTSLAG